MESSALDEKAIKRALKSLVNSAKPSSGAAIAFVTEVKKTGAAVAAQEMTKQAARHLWQSFLNGQGADTAIQSGIHTPALARVLTLQSLILAQKLPIFIRWIERLTEQEEQLTLIQSSLDLQAHLLPHIESAGEISSFDNDIDLLIESIFKQQTSPEISSLWLNSSSSLWRPALLSRAAAIKDTLDLMGRMRASGQAIGLQSKKQDSSRDRKSAEVSLKTIIQGMGCGTALSRQDKRGYRALGKFFYGLNEPVLSACCCQIGQNFVPNEVCALAAARSLLIIGRRPYGLPIVLKSRKTFSQKVMMLLPQSTSSALVTGMLMMVGYIAIAKFDLSIDAFNQFLSEERDWFVTEQLPKITAFVDTLQSTTEPSDEPDFLEGTLLPEEILVENAQLSFMPITLPALRRLTSTYRDRVAEQVSETPNEQQPNEREVGTDTETISPETAMTIVSVLLGRAATLPEIESLQYKSTFDEQNSEIPTEVQNRWIALIATYQQAEGLFPDGIMTIGGVTYQSFLQSAELNQ